MAKRATSDALPAYSRRSLIELRDALGLGHEPRSASRPKPVPTEPFLVTGTVVRAPYGFLLMEDTAVCCVAVTVGFRVAGEAPDGAARVAVYGRLAQKGDTPPRTLFRRSASGFHLIVDGCVIELERIVPAERLVKRDNVIDQITSDSLTIFARALDVTGVGEVLRGTEAITVLAPVDAAFANPDELFRPENRERLRLMVLRHVLLESLRENDLMEQETVTALTREEFRVRVENGRLSIAGARTVFENVTGSNGMLHMIHAVLRSEDATGAANRPVGLRANTTLPNAACRVSDSA